MATQNKPRLYKKYSYKQIMKEVLLNDKVYSWLTLYEALKVNEWIQDRGYNPDVKYMYMSMRFQQYISEILSDKFVYGQKHLFVDKYAYNVSGWDTLCYAPIFADVGDILLIDLTQKADDKKIKEYQSYIPKFIKK